MKTQILLAAGVVIGMTALAPLPAQAGQGPWCAVQTIGASTVTENCSFRSFNHCRSVVIAGNRGFCSQNPAWPGWQRQAYRARY